MKKPSIAITVYNKAYVLGQHHIIIYSSYPIEQFLNKGIPLGVSLMV